MKASKILLFLCLLFGFALTAFSVQAETIKSLWGGTPVYLTKKADNFIILYDRSKSMRDKYADTPLSELAAERKILIETNATLPDMNWQAGIYSFTPGAGVKDLTEFYPMQQYEKRGFSKAIADMPREPQGATLLQQGLWALDRLLANLPGKTVVFLFTDGQYTPVDTLASPGTLASKLAAKYDICFVVINTGAEKKGLEDIKAIAAANNCSYMIPFDTLMGNPEWLTYALFEVVQERPDQSKEVVVGYEWENILFDFDKYNIKQQYLPSLEKVSEFLKSHPETKVILAGHTDNIGPREYNMKLSHKRASSVRNYLVNKKGISPDRITLSGFGFDDPVASNKTKEGRALNRRVQGIITGSE